MKADAVWLSAAAAFLAASLRLAVPVALAALGEAALERSGIVNVGLEGMMLAGAFTGYAAASATGSPPLGAACAALAGAALGYSFGRVVADQRGNPIVAGVALNLVVMGSTTALMRTVFPAGRQPLLPALPQLRVPLLADLPYLGEPVFSQSPYLYALAVAMLLVWWWLYRTVAGLRIAAAGERPQALALAGADVTAPRRTAATVCGLLAGLGGSQIVIEGTGVFTEQATAGRGFVALAIAVVARRHPLLVAPAALAYGASEATALRLMAFGSPAVGAMSELLAGLPFALTLAFYAIASLASSRRASSP